MFLRLFTSKRCIIFEKYYFYEVLRQGGFYEKIAIFAR